MAEKKLSPLLAKILGEEKVKQVTVLRSLYEKLEEFLASDTLTEEMRETVETKFEGFIKLAKRLNQINNMHIKREDMAAKMNVALQEACGMNFDEFYDSLIQEINSIELTIAKKDEEIVLQAKEETNKIADSVDTRISGDIDLVKQQKELLAQTRKVLLEKQKEVADKYNKALVEYKGKRSFFTSFREERSKIDEKTGKKQGMFAAIKAAFASRQESRNAIVDRERKNELDVIYDELTQVENEIVGCDSKLVALSEQRKTIRHDIVKDYSLIASAFKEHADQAKRHEVKLEQYQESLEDKKVRYSELKEQEHVEGESYELTSELLALESEIKELEAKKEIEKSEMEIEGQKAEPTIENSLTELEKIITELKDKAENEKNHNKRSKIEKQIIALEERQRGIMAAVVKEDLDDKKEQVVEEVVEQSNEQVVEEVVEQPVEDANKEEKKELTYKELIALYEKDREAMKGVIEGKIEELRDKMQGASLEERKETLKKLDELNKTKEEYERKLTRREAVRKAREHYDMDR